LYFGTNLFHSQTKGVVSFHDSNAARTTEAPATGNLRTAAAINAQAAALAAAAKLRAAEDERRKARRTNLADKLNG